MFGKKSVGTLMEHQSYDCMIDLKEGAQPPFELIYNCHKMDFQCFWKYINENLEKWFL